MTTEFTALLHTIFNDMATSCIDLRIDTMPDGDATNSDSDETVVFVFLPGGESIGLIVPPLISDAVALQAGDAIHEAVIEARWAAGLSTAWPPCPFHPNSHPLFLQAVASGVSWACPDTSALLHELGRLNVV
jgi:hypothetical protein